MRRPELGVDDPCHHSTLIHTATVPSKPKKTHTATARATYPQHLLGRLGFLLQQIQQLEGILRRFIRSDRLGQRFDARLELSLIHDCCCNRSRIQVVDARVEKPVVGVERWWLGF